MPAHPEPQKCTDAQNSCNTNQLISALFSFTSRKWTACSELVRYQPLGGGGAMDSLLCKVNSSCVVTSKL